MTETSLMLPSLANSSAGHPPSPRRPCPLTKSPKGCTFTAQSARERRCSWIYSTQPFHPASDPENMVPLGYTSTASCWKSYIGSMRWALGTRSWDWTRRMRRLRWRGAWRRRGESCVLMSFRWVDEPCKPCSAARRSSVPLTVSGDGHCDGYDIASTARATHGLWRGVRHDVKVGSFASAWLLLTFPPPLAGTQTSCTRTASSEAALYQLSSSSKSASKSSTSTRRLVGFSSPNAACCLIRLFGN